MLPKLFYSKKGHVNFLCTMFSYMLCSVYSKAKHKNKKKTIFLSEI